LTQLEAIVQQVKIEADAARRLLDAEAAGERADALRELEGEAEIVGRDGADLAVVAGRWGSSCRRRSARSSSCRADR
jgi:hypothetical protein